MSDETERSSLRESEQAVYAQYGLTTREHVVSDTAGAWRVRVVEVGDDTTRPSIVFLHGIASVTAVAVPLIPSLGGRRILAVDLPGHGLSNPFRVPRGEDVGRLLASLIPQVLDRFEIDRADVVAHSLGGQIALRTALAHPECIDRLVLLGAPGAGFAGVEPVPAMRMFAIPGIGTAMLHLPTSLDAYRRNSEALLGPHALDDVPGEIAAVGWHASRRPGYPRSLSSFFRALITPRGVRPGVALTPAELASITLPVLMLWGDQDVFLRPDAGAAEFRKLPHGMLHVLPGGHAPWLDDLAFAGAAISEFVNAPQPTRGEPQ